MGVQQRAWHGVQIDAEYYWKFTDGAYDFDVIFNTPLAFPTQFRKSTHQGGLVRLSLPESHGWQFYTTLSHTQALLFGPELGACGSARPTHPWPNRIMTSPFRPIPIWNTGTAVRSDSGQA